MELNKVEHIKIIKGMAAANSMQETLYILKRYKISG